VRHVLLIGLSSLLVVFCSLIAQSPIYSALPPQNSQTQNSQTQNAQTLNAQGQRYLEQGNPQAALESWQQAEQLYHTAQDETGVLGSQLNQAIALQTLGFYRRARTLLEQIVQPLEAQPPSALTVNGMLTLGNCLRLVGEFERSQTVLQQGLEMAQQLQLSSQAQAAYLYLGNTQFAQQDLTASLRSYQQAAAESGPLDLTAKLRQLPVLQALNQTRAIAPLVEQIESQLATLPPHQTRLYGQIELARWMLQTSPSLPSSVATPPVLLRAAIQQAHTMGDRRAESYARGYLGNWYEQQKLWADAQELTQQALTLADAADASDLAYQWNWQIGRIFKAQNDPQAAIRAYTLAIDTLKSLRSDLVGVTQDVQFSFRQQVEPVYRELADLLLSPHSPELRTDENLATARQVIESLQLAELNNFFREACLDAETGQIDEIDPTAAVFYPILLPNALEVILSIPGQPLQHYATLLPQADIESGIQQMLRSMRSTSFAQERLAAAQQLYQWLVQPVEDELQQHSVKTLVFVLDGSLRNVPMAALHDGQHYLIEQYQIAITPGLQLLHPSTAQPRRLRALVGGVSEGVNNLEPLPGVAQEVDQISRALPAEVLLNQSFTLRSLKQEVDRTPFSILHLATHGQFGSTTQDTFIQTWDGHLTVNDLRALLRQQEDQRLSPIDLLVLSACQTAQGDDRAALGMAGVAVRSGAQSTLASLWAVNDLSTATFITAFYEALTQPGTTKAAAVRQAQLHLLHASAYQHPFYWSPFVLIGDWL
jgi:CHAT domain-containing protein